MVWIRCVGNPHVLVCGSHFAWADYIFPRHVTTQGQWLLLVLSAEYPFIVSMFGVDDLYIVNLVRVQASSSRKGPTDGDISPRSPRVGRNLRLKCPSLAWPTSRGRRGPWVSLRINRLRPDEYLSITKTLLTRQRAFVACWPRAITAQASAATVVTRLGDSDVGHPLLLGVLLPPESRPGLVAMRPKQKSQLWRGEARRTSEWPVYSSKLTSSTRALILVFGLARMMPKPWRGKDWKGRFRQQGCSSFGLAGHGDGNVRLESTGWESTKDLCCHSLLIN